MCTDSVPHRRVQVPSSLGTDTEDVALSSQLEMAFTRLVYVHMVVAKCRRELSASKFFSENGCHDDVQYDYTPLGILWHQTCNNICYFVHVGKSFKPSIFLCIVRHLP
jgi:hypothetical protein